MLNGINDLIRLFDTFNHARGPKLSPYTIQRMIPDSLN